MDFVSFAADERLVAKKKIVEKNVKNEKKKINCKKSKFMRQQFLILWPFRQL